MMPKVPSSSDATTSTVRGSDWDGRENNFDFLRLALAVLVIYSHSFPLGLGSEDAEPVKRLTHGQMTGGAIAVDLFFIISGFLIAASAERTRGMGAFLKKRVQRIYPGFCVLALLTVIFVIPWAHARLAEPIPWAHGRLAEPDLVGRAGNFLLQTLRLREFNYLGAFRHNPFPQAINGSVWSIQYEFWCYVGVALLAASGLLLRRWLVALVFAGSIALSVLFQIRGWILGGKWLGVLLGSPQLWARLLPLYLAGVTFYLFRDRIRSSPWFALGAVAALGLGCMLRFGLTYVFPLAGTYLVFYLAYAPWLRLHGFGRYGDFSYGAYLYAFPVQQLLMQAFGRPVAPWILFACATPPTLLLGAASWYLVERRYPRPARQKVDFA